jgi:hypothetical protein
MPGDRQQRVARPTRSRRMRTAVVLIRLPMLDDAQRAVKEMFA